MAISTPDFFEVLMSGEIAPTGQIPITAEKTAALQEMLVHLDHCEQATVCLRALASRYRERSLINLCMQKLLDVRPRTIDDQYKTWRREVRHLTLSLRGSVWEDDFRQMMKVTYPKVAMNLWPQPVRVEANP